MLSLPVINCNKDISGGWNTVLKLLDVLVHPISCFADVLEELWYGFRIVSGLWILRYEGPWWFLRMINFWFLLLTRVLSIVKKTSDFRNIHVHKILRKYFDHKLSRILPRKSMVPGMIWLRKGGGGAERLNGRRNPLRSPDALSDIPIWSN